MNKLFYSILTLIVIFFISLWFFISFALTSNHRVIVTDKQAVINKSTMESNYLIFTDKTTFKIDDTIWGTLRFDSSDEYGRIEIGECYDIKTIGIRFGLLSMYPNIIKFEKCDEK